MTHEVHFTGFHGPGAIRFRGPREGFVLTGSQARRWRAAVCPYAGSGCLCRGSVPLEFSRAGASIGSTEDGYHLIPCTSA